MTKTLGNCHLIVKRTSVQLVNIFSTKVELVFWGKISFFTYNLILAIDVVNIIILGKYI